MSKGYEQRKEANKRYLDKLDHIPLRLPKGEKEKIRAHAESRGESVNAFITRAIAEAIRRDTTGSVIIDDRPVDIDLTL